MRKDRRQHQLLAGGGGWWWSVLHSELKSWIREILIKVNIDFNMRHVQLKLDLTSSEHMHNAYSDITFGVNSTY